MTSDQAQINVTFVLPGGERRTVSSPLGISIMEAALKHDVPGIIGECGGACACATCHVYVDEAYLPKLETVSEFENEMLEGAAAGRQTNSRLSCQLRLSPETSGIIVIVPKQM